jgi:hypothetical protein
LKIPITKKAAGVTQDEGPEFKPHYSKKRKRSKERKERMSLELMLCDNYANIVLNLYFHQLVSNSPPTQTYSLSKPLVQASVTSLHTPLSVIPSSFMRYSVSLLTNNHTEERIMMCSLVVS